MLNVVETRRAGGGRGWLARRAMLVALLALALSCSRASGEAGQGRGGRPAPVEVATVERKSMPVEVHTVGTVEAMRTVSILPQVGGEIREVHFKEGDVVAKGDLLFTIDTRPYRATLSEARARLAKSEALAEQAREEADRAQRLYQQGLTSQQDYERARAQADSTQAALRADRASVAGASIDVDFTTIRSPIDGRSGSLLVHAGNVVKPADRPLVVLRQIKPIHVRFAVPEQYLSRVRQRMSQQPLTVTARPRGHSGEPAQGTLTFIDNAVDSTTGTLEMKAKFDNADELLWPGQFTEVTLRLATQDDALVIPESAIQSSQDGDTVFVVTDDGKAELRKVTLERQVGEETIVQAGLSAGERVVVDGQVRLASGTPVEIMRTRALDGQRPAATVAPASAASAAPRRTPATSAANPSGTSPERR